MTTANPDRTPMLPTSLAIQIDAGTAAGVSTARLHGIGSDFVMAVWESAAIGMAAGAGLLLLAVTVTAIHFLIIVGFMPVARRLAARLSGSVRMHVTYEEGRGVMTQLLAACDRRRWQLTELAADPGGKPLDAPAHLSGAILTLAGNGVTQAPLVLAGIDGVTSIRQLDEDPD